MGMDRLLVYARYCSLLWITGRNLSAWAANGVLLLNTCLTVRAREAGSHSNKGWEQFTDRVVDVIDRYGGANLGGRDASAQSIGTSRGIVFLAWGSWAQKRVSRLDKARVKHSFHRRRIDIDPRSP
jgi:uracil-DNA glycosylase